MNILKAFIAFLCYLFWGLIFLGGWISLKLEEEQRKGELKNEV